MKIMMGALNNPELVNDEVEEEASIDTDIDSDENGDIVDLNGNTVRLTLNLSLFENDHFSSIN